MKSGLKNIILAFSGCGLAFCSFADTPKKSLITVQFTSVEGCNANQHIEFNANDVGMWVAEALARKGVGVAENMKETTKTSEIKTSISYCGMSFPNGFAAFSASISVYGISDGKTVLSGSGRHVYAYQPGLITAGGDSIQRQSQRFTEQIRYAINVSADRIVK